MNKGAEFEGGEEETEVGRVWTSLEERLKLDEVPAGDPGSREWLDNAGKFWKITRIMGGVYRADMALRLDSDRHHLALFENGLVDQKTFQGDLPLRYAEVLGLPQAYDEFCARFQVAPYTPPQQQVS